MFKNEKFRRIYQGVLAFLAWLGPIWILVNGVIHRDPGMGVIASLIKLLSNYTPQTNFMVAIWLTLAMIYWQRENEQPILLPKIKGALVTYITVTWLIYAIFLAPRHDFAGIAAFMVILTHWITPIGFIIHWLLFTERRVYKWVYAIHWLIYPLLYVVFAQIYGSIIGEYLYFFLDVIEYGWGGVLVNVLAMTGFFIALGCMYVAINRWLKPDTV